MTGEKDPGLPFVVIESLDLGGESLIRVVGQSNHESEAHALAQTMARAGCRVWLLDLWGSGEGSGPQISRYANPASAIWALEHGVEISGIGGPDRASEAGR